MRNHLTWLHRFESLKTILSHAATEKKNNWIIFDARLLCEAASRDGRDGKS